MANTRGLEALTPETGRVDVMVAGVGLVRHALQVLVYFIGTTGHITLGVPSGCGTSVIASIILLCCLYLVVETAIRFI